MAREHARIWIDINSDDDFEQLPFDAQGFYTRVILTLDDLSYCGVARWLPKKLTTKAPDLPLQRILAAAQALEADRYCLFDLTTEEVLARSFIRRDQLLRNPKMAASVIKAFSGIASKVLRAAVVTEIRRVREEHPEYSSWSHPEYGPALSKIMAKPGSDEVPYTDQIAVPITNGQVVPISNRIGNHDAVPISDPDSVANTKPIGNAESVPIPSTYTSTTTPAPLGGYVSTEGHQEPEPVLDDPPSPYCSKHPIGTNLPCRDCRAAREHRDAWEAQQADLTAQRRAAFKREVADCPDCDELGWIDNGRNGVTRCPKHDWDHADA